MSDWMRHRGMGPPSPHTGWHGPRQADSDLNTTQIITDDGPISLTEVRKNLAPTQATVEAVFNDVVGRLVEEIQRWPVVLGCVAWLTEGRVLAALAQRQMVSILVQKEDFLRPDDTQTEDTTRAIIRAAYSKLPVGSRYSVPGAPDLGPLSYACDPTLAPVRCVGVRPNDPRSRNHPRMHHKFFVFCSAHAENERRELEVQPEAVWTGSFNPTANGRRSLENALLVQSRDVALAYSREHYAMLAISEPLNWSERYVAPEYRIGS